MKRGVTQGTFLRTLLSNIYINELGKIVEKDCTVVQYADETFLFTSNTDEISSKTKLEHNTSKIIEIFCKIPVSGEQTKTEYNVFSTRERLTNTVPNVDNEKTAECNSVENLGVIVDRKLIFDGEVKKILQRMACCMRVVEYI